MVGARARVRTCQTPGMGYAGNARSDSRFASCFLSRLHGCHPRRAEFELLEPLATTGFTDTTSGSGRHHDCSRLAEDFRWNAAIHANAATYGDPRLDGIHGSGCGLG